MNNSSPGRGGRRQSSYGNRIQRPHRAGPSRHRNARRYPTRLASELVRRRYRSVCPLGRTRPRLDERGFPRRAWISAPCTADSGRDREHRLQPNHSSHRCTVSTRPLAQTGCMKDSSSATRSLIVAAERVRALVGVFLFAWYHAAARAWSARAVRADAIHRAAVRRTADESGHQLRRLIRSGTTSRL